jgi:uncharacterized protein (TIGR03086 family)
MPLVADVDMLRALDAATDEFGRRLALVDEASWALPTPCAEWDVHYLVAHVIGGNRFAMHALDGTSASDAIERIMSSPQVGDDAMETWDATTAGQRSAFHEVMASERQIDHPLGSISGATFLEFRVFDIALHTWDLARAIGADEQLPPSLVDTVLGVVESGAIGMGFGIAPIRGVQDTSPQARLLALTGRLPA